MRTVILIGIIVVMACITGCVDSGGGTDGGMQEGASVNITSGGRDFPAYLAAPGEGGPFPGVVLIHSFNGLEPGYREMVERFSGEGFVVIAPEWQTYEESPPDNVVETLVRDAATYLGTRADVDESRLGLTGFCAGGRYTMLFLPRIEEFGSGVAWYGFPYSGGFNNETAPATLIDEMADPLLILHGTRDQASPVADIYRYAADLDAADRYFELKVYQGEPHGFMIENGTLSQSSVAQDAYGEMVSFFNRTLG